MQYYVEFKIGLFAAPWGGDPATTTDIKKAAFFDSRDDAEYVKTEAQELFNFRLAAVRTLPKNIS